MSETKQFVKELRDYVGCHTATNHPLLCRLAQTPFTKEDYKNMGIQHYPLATMSTKYLEHFLTRLPGSDSKIWVTKVLLDHYGQRSQGKNYILLYESFLKAAGIKEGEQENTSLHPAVPGFLATHLHLVHEENLLVALGALGPAQIWAIPKMFPHIVKGLLRAGFSEADIEYFLLQLEQVKNHGLWLEEIVCQFCESEQSRHLIKNGTETSLRARAWFWTGVQDKIVRWRQPKNLHLRSQNKVKGYRPKKEITFNKLRDMITANQDLASFKAAQ